jgi:hypothetical protein
MTTEINRHYKINKDGLVVRRLINCHKCWSPCNPNTFNAVMATSYKCTNSKCRYVVQMLSYDSTQIKQTPTPPSPGYTGSPLTPSAA